MKKILSSILIVLILVNVFAPFTIKLGANNSPILQKNLAEAAGGYVTIEKGNRTGTSLSFIVTIARDKTDNHYAVFVFSDSPGTKETSIPTPAGDFKDLVPPPGTPKTPPYYQSFNPADGKETTNANTPQGWVEYQFEFNETGLKPSTTYYVSSALQNGTSQGGYTSTLDTPIATTAGEVDNTREVISRSDTEDGFMPSCGIGNTWFTHGTIMGCVAQIIYYLFFQSTSFLFGLTGTFFDNVFAYSVNSSSYDTGFVLEGWGVVRDFCNIFFIFVLLYIAFSTILNIHGFKTKEMVINVVIIGLLINFSLFACHIIIDTSNILARVFYNSNVIKLKDNNNNPVELKAGEPIPLSAAIVAKVEPQRLIIDGTKNIAVVDKVTGKSSKAGTGSNIGTGTFILITLLAIAVNIVGMIVFLSVGLIFVARVIGLWIYMIFAPFAFFSYTVPSMQGMDMVGWKKWWPELLSLSFLAPVFIFFLYLILKFLNVIDIVKTSGSGGIGFVVSIIVPFAFIMILLTKAKSIAKKMSGELGQSITGAVSAAGGLALGGAALGGAALLRGTVGATAKYVQNDAARNKDAKTFGGYKQWSLGKKLNPFAYVGQAGKTINANIARGIHAIPGGGGKTLGAKMQEADRGFGEKTHATQMLNDKMQSEFGHQYGKDAKYSDLTEHEQTVVKQEVDKDELAKLQFGKKFKDLEAPQAQAVKQQYDAGTRAIADEHGKSIRLDHKDNINTRVDANGNRTNLDVNGQQITGEKVKSDSIVDFSKINASTGEFVQALRKGSMDIRNLSQSKAVSKGFPKMAVGLLAAVAAGTRMGLKESGVNHGTGQKDFLKDLKNTLTDSLKSLKVKVDVKHGGDDDHGKEAKSVGH